MSEGIRGAPDLEPLRVAADPTILVEPDPGSPSSVALLAGSFDPITVGHDAMARAAARWAQAVLLVYAVRTLPKDGAPTPPLLSEPERLRVLHAFCTPRRGMAVALCSHGLLAEQVEAAARRFPAARLAVVAGSDKVLQLLHPRWYPEGRRDAVLGTMFGRAEVWYAVREGDGDALASALDLPANRPFASRIRALRGVDPEVADVSSRRVRERARQGRDVSGLVPPEALAALVRAAAARRDRPV